MRIYTVTPTAEPTDPTSSPSYEPTTLPSKSPSTIPTALPTNHPIAFPSDSPSTDPTEAPTQDPSPNPSVTPTETPSAVPTSNSIVNINQSPSMEPTSATMTPLCEIIRVHISGYVGADSADEFITGLTDQQKTEITNMTHHAIADSATEYNVDSDSFYMELRSMSDALYIFEDYCTFTAQILNVLKLAITDDANEISTVIRGRWISTFGEGTKNEALNVTIDTIELRVCFVQDKVSML